VGAVQQLLPTVDAEVLEQRFEVNAAFTLRLPRDEEPRLRDAIQNLTRGAANYALVD
jgi:hypothetical protein